MRPEIEAIFARMDERFYKFMALHRFKDSDVEADAVAEDADYEALKTILLPQELSESLLRIEEIGEAHYFEMQLTRERVKRMVAETKRFAAWLAATGKDPKVATYGEFLKETSSRA
jgi:hypothetical protein